MKKIVLTMAVVFMAFAATAQRIGVDYNYEIDDYDGYNNNYDCGSYRNNYGDAHKIQSYGDLHYIGSHYHNDAENEDVFTKLGIVGRSTSYGSEDYGYEGVGNYRGGGLLGRGPQREGLFSGGGIFSPNIPSHGTNQDTDAPLGGGVLLLVGMGAAYAVSKKRNGK